MHPFDAQLDELVARCESMRADVDAVRRAGVTTLDELCALLADRSAATALRTTAAWLVARLDEPRAAAALDSALDDAALELEVRREAVIGLGMVGATASVDRLLRLLEDDAEMRHVSAHALGEIGDRRAHAPLLAVLADRSLPADLRGQAAESLSSIDGAIDAVPALIVALGDSEPEVRFFAAFALGVIGDPRALIPLDHLAETDRAELSGYGAVCEEAREAAEHIRRDA
jgi:HEAT repeat protein